MAKVTTKKDIVKVTLEMSYNEGSALFDLLDTQSEHELLGTNETNIYEALRAVLV